MSRPPSKVQECQDTCKILNDKSKTEANILVNSLSRLTLHSKLGVTLAVKKKRQDCVVHTILWSRFSQNKVVAMLADNNSGFDLEILNLARRTHQDQRSVGCWMELGGIGDLCMVM